MDTTFPIIEKQNYVHFLICSSTIVPGFVAGLAVGRVLVPLPVLVECWFRDVGAALGHAEGRVDDAPSR